MKIVRSGMEKGNLIYQEQKVMESRYCLPYNWLGQKWSRSWRQKNGLWSIARKIAGTFVGKMTLDAGCGDGWYTAQMAKESENVHGIDLSERAIMFASIINTLPNFTQGSLTNTGYKEKYFDFIFSFQVIEHIPPEQLSGVVSELFRILKDDGKLVVTVPSINREMSRAHFQHFTPESLSKAFSKYFELKTVCGQEKHTWALHVVERMIENRHWVLKNIGEKFNSHYFIKYWNKTTPEEGQNLVALFVKNVKT